MENASKALLIAAAILIAILLIVFGIRILNSPKDVAQDTRNIGNSISLTIDRATASIKESFTPEHKGYGSSPDGDSGTGGGDLKPNNPVSNPEPGNDPPQTTPEREEVLDDKSYVGYYADFDNDGNPEGIIYADLAVGTSDYWMGQYEYSSETELKGYCVTNENYTEGKFGNKPRVYPKKGTIGKDRFYVMALKDIKVNGRLTYSWYSNAKSKLDGSGIENIADNDFGAGKGNTIKMLDDWNNKTDTYGAQDRLDLWGAIQSSEYSLVSNGGKWFVPSKSEWSAFADYVYTKLGVNESNYYNDFGLNTYYWSSSTVSSTDAVGVNFMAGQITRSTVDTTKCVRLSATF